MNEELIKNRLLIKSVTFKNTSLIKYNYRYKSTNKNYTNTIYRISSIVTQYYKLNI